MSLAYALQKELANPLPGPEYHKKLIPTNRPYLQIESESGTEAAVSVIIVRHESIHYILFIKRPEYKGHHSSQVSFPGGKKDAVDESILDTAIRETKEEIGLNLLHCELLGELTPLYIQLSGFKVYPFVFFLPYMPKFKIDPKEVDYLIKARVSEVLNENTIQQTQFKVGEYFIETPYFDMEDEIIWGATSMILAEFKEILLRINKKNPELIIRD